MRQNFLIITNNISFALKVSTKDHLAEYIRRVLEFQVKITCHKYFGMLVANLSA